MDLFHKLAGGDGAKGPMTWDNRESVRRKAIRRSDLLRWDTPIFRKSQVSLGPRLSLNMIIDYSMIT